MGDLSAVSENAADDINRKSTQYTDFLLKCMQTRLEIAHSLRQLNQAQATAAVSGETDALLGILSRKQNMLESLTSVQEVMQPYEADDPETRVWSSPELRERCREIASEGSRLLAEAFQVENATLEEFTSKREAIAAQLRDAGGAISAHNAYAANDQISGSVLDIGGV